MTNGIVMLGAQSGLVNHVGRPTGMLLHSDKPNVFLVG